MALRERRLGIARRPTEKVVELPRRHREPGRIIEIALVQPEGAVLLEVDDVFEDPVGVGGRTVGRKAHDLVLARIDFEAGVVREGRIEQPDAMRPVDLAHRLKCVAAADGNRCRGPLADAVHGQHDRLLKWGGKEGGSRMALVVLGEEKLAIDLAAWREGSKRLLQFRLLKELFLDPEWASPFGTIGNPVVRWPGRSPTDVRI